MAYNSSLSGELTIKPPITWRDYRDSPFLPGDEGSDAIPVEFREERVETHTDDGTTTVRRAVAVVDRWYLVGKYYTLLEQLQWLAEKYGSQHQFHGWLVRVGEDQGDVERYTIRGTEVITEQAVLRWPDGTPAP